jgi:HK97 family phage prohead protease
MPDEYRDFAEYEDEYRAKYTQSEIDEMGAKGQAFKNSDGHYSYPIGDESDLKKAIKAVGRGNADHDAIRKYVIGRAKDLGSSSLIPDNWNSDGSLKEGKATPKSLEWRKRRAADMRGTERRTFPLDSLELRASDDGSTLHLSGYASVTGEEYEMGWYTETMQRGAFKKTLAENPDVQLLVNHAGLPLARTLSGTLQLSEDKKGLKVSADMDGEDPDAQSLARKVKRGDVDQMSLAFRATRQEWNEDYSKRYLTEVDVHRGDVSVVNQGANPATSVSVRTDDAVRALQHLGTIGILEAFLEIRKGDGPPSPVVEELITRTLELSSAADGAMDEAQPLLAELLAAPQSETEPPAETDPPEGPLGERSAPVDETLEPLLDHTTSARARLEAIRHAPQMEFA